MRRQAKHWEKIFTKDISDKVILSKIHRELLKHNNKKNNLIKMSKISEQTAHQRTYIDDK